MTNIRLPNIARRDALTLGAFGLGYSVKPTPHRTRPRKPPPMTGPAPLTTALALPQPNRYQRQEAFTLAAGGKYQFFTPFDHPTGDAYWINRVCFSVGNASLAFTVRALRLGLVNRGNFAAANEFNTVFGMLDCSHSPLYIPAAAPKLVVLIAYDPPAAPENPTFTLDFEWFPSQSPATGIPNLSQSRVDPSQMY